jgi:drug/metabolite transporter, DME family
MAGSLPSSSATAVDPVVELWNNRAMARLQVLLAALCFGTTGTAQALGPNGIDPAAVGAARIACGGALLVLFALLVRRRPGPAWARGAVLAGAAGVAAYQASFFAAVDVTGVAVGTIVALGSAPAITGALEWLLHGRRPPGRWAAATALAGAGVALLALAGGAEAGISPLGVGLAVIAGASYAAYTLASKRLLEDGHSPEGVMAALFGLGAVALAPVLFVVDSGPLGSPAGLALVLFLGVVPTAVAYVLFARGLRRLSASETATLTLAEPLTAGLLGAVVLSEPVTGMSAAGAGLVLAGLFALALRMPPLAPPRRATA